MPPMQIVQTVQLASSGLARIPPQSSGFGTRRKAGVSCVFYSLLCALFLSCLSVEITLSLPQTGEAGIVELRYSLAEGLQNISNYPAPRDDIAPLPLPLLEWDFRAIAAQSQGIVLLAYSFQPAKQGQAEVYAKLSFRSEEDLRLLLGPELQWGQGHFRWQLSAGDAGGADQSYPQLSGALSAAEQKLLTDLFAGEHLQLLVQRAASGKDTAIAQRIAMSDFITGKKNIDINMDW